MSYCPIRRSILYILVSRFLIFVLVPYSIEAQNLVKNISIDAEGSGISHVQAAKSGIVFTASDEDGSRNIYFTNDTLNSPRIVFKTGNIPANQLIWSMGTVGDSVFYFTKVQEEVKLFFSSLISGETVLLRTWQTNSGISSSWGKFTRVGNLVYFITRFNAQFELWVTDGSTSGTRFRALTPEGLFPENLFSLGNKLIITDGGPPDEAKLWSYDGTVFVNFATNISPYGFQIVPYDGMLFFPAQADTFGYELWYSDGTVNGTNMLKDINVGRGGSYPTQFAEFDNTLYFRAHDTLHGAELWKTDGTTPGTIIVTDLWEGLESSYPDNITPSLSDLFFTAVDSVYGHELWTLNSLQQSPKRLTDLNMDLQDSDVDNLRATDTFLFFTFSDSSTGTELYRSDGTEVGTVFLKDIYQGPENSGIRSMIAFDNSMYFVANDCIHGEELWVSKGSVGNTVLKHDLNLGESGSNPHGFFRFNENLFFKASEKSTGVELYISDGTTEGTQLVDDILQGVSSSYPGYFTELDSHLYFLANNAGLGKTLYRMDGTASNTLPTGDEIILNGIEKVNNVLIMDVYDALYGTEPWAFTGDTSFLLKDIHPTSSSFARIKSAIEFQGNLYFTADDGVHGREIWKTDGTPEGTALLKDLVPGVASSSVGFMTPFDSFFLFSGVYHSDSELWISDGTAEGTYQLKEINPGINGSRPIGFYQYKNEIYFAAYDYYGRELWKTDGTTEGTILVKDINLDGSSYPQNFMEAGGNLFFTAMDSRGMELWSTDGSSSGTILLRDIFPGSLSSNPWDLISVDDVLIFSATDSTHGREIWKSDGTTEGTRILVDLLPGQVGSEPHSFANLNGQILFGANATSEGNELWDLAGLCLKPFYLALVESPITTGIFQAEHTIESSAQIISNETVQFIAGNQVDLLGGFEVNSNAIFSIEIETCSEE